VFTSFNHIGVAVENLEESITLWTQRLGFELVSRQEIKERGLKLAFLHGGGAPIELLEDITGQGTVGKFIAKYGPGLHHLAFNVADIDRVMEELKALEMEFTTPQAYIGAEGMKVAFIHPRSTGGLLLELVEKR